MQPDEGFAVRRQNKRIGVAGGEGLVAVEIIRQGIGIRLRRENPDIGADLGQDLIPRDQNFLRLVLKAGLFWRMTAPDHDAEAISADR